jgi:hypothetical protein
MPTIVSTSRGRPQTWLCLAVPVNTVSMSIVGIVAAVMATHEPLGPVPCERWQMLRVALMASVCHRCLVPHHSYSHHAIAGKELPAALLRRAVSIPCSLKWHTQLKVQCWHVGCFPIPVTLCAQAVHATSRFTCCTLNRPDVTPGVRRQHPHLCLRSLPRPLARLGRL